MNGLVLKISRGLAVTAAWLYVLAMAAVMPFYFDNGYGSIGTNKSQFFHRYGFPLVVAALAAAALYGLVTLAVIYRKTTNETFWKLIKEQISVTDIWMLLYLGALLLSYVFTRYPATARMGNDSWYMGFLPHLALITSYFVLSRVFRGFRVFVPLVLTVTGIVFALAVLNRYGIFPFEMAYPSPQFISTIGNINWYCGYWSVLIWISMLCFWMTGKKRAGFIYGISMVLGLATGISQGSDSGILALAAGMLLLFAISVPDGQKMARFSIVMFLFSLTCALLYVVNRLFPEACTFTSIPFKVFTQTLLPWVMLFFFGAAAICLNHVNNKGTYPVSIMVRFRKYVFIFLGLVLAVYVVMGLVNTYRPGSLGILSQIGWFTFDMDWGSQRGGTWVIGMEIWNSQDFVHRLFGVGPDCMGDYIYKSGNIRVLEMVQSQFARSTLLNAHGEWINNIVNLGLAGAGVFAGLMVNSFLRFLKKGKEYPVMYLFAFCILGYTVNNIFSFQTTLNTTQLFIFMGIGESLLRQQTKKGVRNEPGTV